MPWFIVFDYTFLATLEIYVFYPFWCVKRGRKLQCYVMQGSYVWALRFVSKEGCLVQKPWNLCYIFFERPLMDYVLLVILVLDKLVNSFCSHCMIFNAYFLLYEDFHELEKLRSLNQHFMTGNITDEKFDESMNAVDTAIQNFLTKCKWADILTMILLLQDTGNKWRQVQSCHCLLY